MDYITSCYYSKMRLYRDRPDVLVNGRWRWCPPGAKVIPFNHLYGSFTMDAGEERMDPPVGEVPLWNGRSNGEANPRYTGQHFCGTQEDWERGPLYSQRGSVPVDAEGVPLCCDAPYGVGGIVVGDSALWPDALLFSGEAEGAMPNAAWLDPFIAGELEGAGLVELEQLFAGEAEGAGLVELEQLFAGEAEGEGLHNLPFPLVMGELEGAMPNAAWKDPFIGGEAEGAHVTTPIGGGGAGGGELLDEFVQGSGVGGGELFPVVGGGGAGGGELFTDWIYLPGIGGPMPRVIYLDIADAGSCAALAGTYPLTFEPVFGRWEADFEVDGVFVHYSFFPDQVAPAKWKLTYSDSVNNHEDDVPLVWSLPFSFDFGVMGPGSLACVGTWSNVVRWP